MKEKIIHLLGGYTIKDICRYNAIILNEFQNQGTTDMPVIAYDEKVCLIPAIDYAMKSLPLLTKK